MISGGDFGFERVSVSSQRGDAGSFLNWIADLTRTRRECAEIGTGEWTTVDVGNDAVLCLRYDTSQRTVVVLNNLAPGRRTITLDLSDDECASATDLFGDRLYTPVTPQNQSFVMNGNGYRWLRLSGVY